MRAASRPIASGCHALAVWLAAAVALSACQTDEAAAPTLTDDGALRAKVSACLGTGAAATFTFFWPTYLGGAPNARDCVAAAADCADVLACAGYASPGCTPDDDRCDGGRAVACQQLVGGLTAATESLCDGDLDGNTVCSIAEDAKYGRGAFCHGASCTGERCEGSVIVRCRGGLDVRYDCAREGKGCAIAAGQAYCAYEETCASDRCTGDVMELCIGGRVSLRERCGELVPGSTCTDRMGLVECLAKVPSDGCAGEADFQSWCDGTTAVTCLAGVRAELDCGTLAGGRCEMTTREETTDARCVGAF